MNLAEEGVRPRWIAQARQHRHKPQHLMMIAVATRTPVKLVKPAAQANGIKHRGQKTGWMQQRRADNVQGANGLPESVPITVTLPGWPPVMVNLPAFRVLQALKVGSHRVRIRGSRFSVIGGVANPDHVG